MLADVLLLLLMRGDAVHNGNLSSLRRSRARLADPMQIPTSMNRSVDAIMYAYGAITVYVMPH
jgi:hypothetical protein